MSQATRIMCFGDSLTWGSVPVANGQATTRYPFAERWPGAMLAALHSETAHQVEIVEEGLSGRTTVVDDPTDPRLNGMDYLPSALVSHLPIDIVIIMLGTNDTKAIFGRSAFEIAHGISRLIAQVARSAGGVNTTYAAPTPILVAPPVLGELAHPWRQVSFAGAKQKTIEMAKLYAAFADYSDIAFLNAGDVISTDGVDGIHLTAQNNIDLGHAIAGVVSSVLSLPDNLS